MAEEAKKSDSENKLRKYEWADLANSIYPDKSRGFYSLGAMHNLYTKGFGLDKDDPIIARALAEAHAGMSVGQVTSACVLQAMSGYAKKFDNAVESASVGDFLAFVGYKIPEKLKPLLEKYETTEIGKLNEKDKEQAKVIAMIQILRNHLREGKLFNSLVKKNTQSGLESLVEEEK